MIDRNKKRIQIIVPNAVYTVFFSKGYKAETEELLTKKVQFARNGTLDYLATLDVIPQSVNIKGRSTFYKLQNGTAAAKIDFYLGYYNLCDSSFEKKEEIFNNISKQRHHLECLKNKIYSHSGIFHELRKPIVKTECGCKKSITAKTKDELIQKIKQAIWDLLKEDESSSTVPTEFNLHHIEFFQTPEGFEAQYSYILHHDNRVLKVNPNNTAINQSADDGRDE